MKKMPTTIASSIEILEVALRYDRNTRLIAALALFGTSYAFFYSYFFLDWRIWFLFIGLACNVFGTALIVGCINNWTSSRHPLLLLLKHEPKQIVWVYSVVTQNQPFGVHVFQGGLLYFYLADSQFYAVRLPVAELEKISSTMSDYLTHATFGYSQQKRQLYSIAPDLLIQDLEDECE